VTGLEQRIERRVMLLELRANVASHAGNAAVGRRARHHQTTFAVVACVDCDAQRHNAPTMSKLGEAQQRGAILCHSFASCHRLLCALGRRRQRRRNVVAATQRRRSKAARRNKRRRVNRPTALAQRHAFDAIDQRIDVDAVVIAAVVVIVVVGTLRTDVAVAVVVRREFGESIVSSDMNDAAQTGAKRSDVSESDVLC
jgi:hypothetical protein